MGLFDNLKSKLKPSQAIAGITDAVLARLTSNYDMKFVLTFQNNSLVCDPQITPKSPLINIDKE